MVLYGHRYKDERSHNKDVIQQDLRNIRRLAPPTPQFWGELDLVPPKVGGLGGQVRKSYQHLTLNTPARC